METQTKTEPEVPQNPPSVNPSDVSCDICHRTFPGTGSLRKHMDKVHKCKGKFKCPKCHKVYITNKDKRTVN